MRKRKYGTEEIVGKLREAEVLIAQSRTVADTARQIGVTEQSYYRWHREYGGMRSDQAKRLGGGYSAISATLIGCSTARNKGTCDNRLNIRRDELESRVLNALRTRLVDPPVFARFCEVFTQEMNRLRMAGRAEIAAAEAEIEKIDHELAKLPTAIRSGGPIEAIVGDMKRLEARKEELTAYITWRQPMSRRPFCIPQWLSSTARAFSASTMRCRMWTKRSA